MELKSINLSKIPADPLVDFGLEVKNLGTNLGSTVSYIQPAYGNFLSWHLKGVALREFSRKNYLTKEPDYRATSWLRVTCAAFLRIASLLRSSQ